jgi:hypothetical protein
MRREAHHEPWWRDSVAADGARAAGDRSEVGYFWPTQEGRLVRNDLCRTGLPVLPKSGTLGILISTP